MHFLRGGILLFDFKSVAHETHYSSIALLIGFTSATCASPVFLNRSMLSLSRLRRLRRHPFGAGVKFRQILRSVSASSGSDLAVEVIRAWCWCPGGEGASGCKARPDGWPSESERPPWL